MSKGPAPAVKATGNGELMSKITLEYVLGKLESPLTEQEIAAVRAHVETIQRAGIESVQALVDAVGDEATDTTVRAIACWLLGRLRERRARPALECALEHGEDGGLAWEAAKALAGLRDRRATPTLLRVLNEGSPQKQVPAAWALGWTGSPAAVPVLRAVAADSARAVDVRAHATEALGVLYLMGVRQARRAVPDLIAMLSSESPELRYEAAYSLGQIGDPAAIPALERAAVTETAVLFKDRSVKQEMLDALAEIRRGGPRFA